MVLPVHWQEILIATLEIFKGLEINSIGFFNSNILFLHEIFGLAKT